MTDEPWLEITVEVAGIDTEIAADLLRQACPGGVAVETPSRLDRETETYVPDGDGPALVKGYLHPGPEAERVQQNMRLALQTAPLQRPAVWREPTLLADADWRDSWKRYFGVQRVGRRLVIVPSWVNYAPKPDDIILFIDPGMAFGTGQHQTTAMCLAALEDVIATGQSVLDLGCGSGILAIAAARLGAAPVIAIDNDPQAIKATQENAAANGVAVEARLGTLEAAGERFDVVVANISGLTLQRLAPLLFASLTQGGTLIASGFLDEALASLTAAFQAAGLHSERVIQDGPWRTVVARRPA
ncbi:MAG TPA: 50S ribosomal protein L11 methyltransferase [Dehalococcoidia bacterium]|nr:50S ribosomal protein L11 methyltransferase [Dehalococcoidia bacterium]